MNTRDRRFKLSCTSAIIVVIITISASQIPFIPSSYDNTANAKKYSNHFEQAASLTNECSGEHESSQICVNNNPQTQGSNNLVETPVGTTFTSSPESRATNPIVTQREGNVVDLIGEVPVVTSTATCNSDEVVVGGGFIATDNINIRKEGKVDNSWQIEAIGGEAERQGDTLQTLAMCLNFTGD